MTSNTNFSAPLFLTNECIYVYSYINTIDFYWLYQNDPLVCQTIYETIYFINLNPLTYIYIYIYIKIITQRINQGVGSDTTC